MISQKTITLNGAPIEICGRSGDSYFDHLNLNDGTNNFLIQTISRPPTTRLFLMSAPISA